jgi:parallel beta-helix repeat protein
MISLSFYLKESNDNRITGNVASNSVNYHDISLKSSNNNEIRDNIADSNHYDGIKLRNSTDHIISNNTVKNNEDDGISLMNSSNNRIYMNNFLDNQNNVYSEDSTNIWHSTSERTYRFKGNTHTNYLSSYWDDYAGSDTDNNGIGDRSYNINSDNDNYPLKEPVENYFLPIRLDSWK